MKSWELRRAAASVEAGGGVAYPPEAVFGRGCDPLDERAVLRLLALKRRPWSKGLILVAAAWRQFLPYLRRSDSAMRARLRATWPGPVTWVVPAGRETPEWIRGRHAGVALRVSAHPCIRALCLRTGPLVSTSANPRRCPPALTARRVRAYFGDRLDYLLAGALGQLSAPTEIREAASGAVLRGSPRGAAA